MPGRRQVSECLGVHPANAYWICTVSRRAQENRRRRYLEYAFGTVGTAGAPFNRGRRRRTKSATGHLRHIWADTEDCSGTDFVADTPNAAGRTTETEVPHVTCNNGPSGTCS